MPALNKWLACYPMLGWMVLGTLLHGLMPRVWRAGILSLPNIILPEHRDDGHAGGGPNACPEVPEVPDDMDGDAADVGDAPGGAQESEEDLFRRRRSQRALRVHRWMSSSLTQMWSCNALFITEPIALVVGHFLQDEYMFSPDLVRHAPGALRPWVPTPRGDADRPVPTLWSFMSSNMEVLRNLQTRVLCVLDDVVNGTAFLQLAFQDLGQAAVFEAMQHLALEALGDLYMRFYCHYRGFPHALVKLAFTDLDLATRREVAQQFHELKECCRRFEFEDVLKKRFPTPEALLHDDSVGMITAWATTQQLCTTSVEFEHRSNAAFSQGKGPAKPSDIHTIANMSIVSKVQKFHGAAVGSKSSNRRSLHKPKKHPRIQKLIAKVKKLGKATQRIGIGGNPKWHYLNMQRQQLRNTGLSRQEFADAVTRLKHEYDTSLAVQVAARDAWRLARMQRFEGSGVQDQQLDQRCHKGPWDMGDSFWPVREELLQSWLDHNTSMGGHRAAADEHRKWLDDNLSFGDEALQHDVEPATLQKTCAEAHPGYCVEEHKDVKDQVENIIHVLHGIRSVP